jgi:hypothetical protein
MSRPLLGLLPRKQVTVSISANTYFNLQELTAKLRQKDPKAHIGLTIDKLASNKKPVKPSTAPRVQTVTQHGKA